MALTPPGRRRLSASVDQRCLEHRRRGAGRPAGLAWAPRRLHLANGRALSAAAGVLQLRLVDHLNRNVAAARRSASRARRTRPRAFVMSSRRLAEFHARTIQYLQQMTAYIDTRDRRAAGGALVLNASLSGLAENVDKRWESLAVRDERADARARALAAAQDELRAMLGVVQQASLALKREVERILSGQERSRAFEAGARGSAGAAGAVQRQTHAGGVSRRSTATSTSASKISFAARATRSGRGSKATFRSSPARRTCSTSAAGAASFSSSLPAPASATGHRPES